MRRVKLTLEYDGTNFRGWQVQAGTGQRTVQGVLEAALAQIPGARPKAVAAGRTDSGVHALAMVCHYDTEDSIPTRNAAKALGRLLPPDVRVLAAEHVADDFEARFSCHYRRYLYRLHPARADPRGAALNRLRALHLYQPLDVKAMRHAAPLFAGRRDFAALATQETRTTEREVFFCQLEPSGDELVLHVAADGFLRGMVRAIVGTLLWVGEGKLEPEGVPALLASRQRHRAGKNAPPHGLYFAEAGYVPWDEARFSESQQRAMSEKP